MELALDESTVEEEAPKRRRKPKAETVGLKIKSMGGRFATGGFNVVPGLKGKIKPGDVIELPADVAESLAGDVVEITQDPVTCRLVNGEVAR